MPLSLTTARRVTVPALAAAALTASLLATAAPALAGNPGSRPLELTTLGTRVLFIADDGSSGQELWQTDGTTTSLLKQIGPGAASGDPSDLVKAGSLVFFTADDGGGTALWRTNGTTAGTKELPGPGPYGAAVTAVGSRVYFPGYDGATGAELYTSNGTAAGTKRLTDLRPGVDDSVDRRTLAPFGGRVAFGAYGADGGTDLWSSGPTVGSAKRIKNLPATATIDWIRNVAGTLYLQVQPTPGTFELWKSDGTKAGTVKVKTLPNTAAYQTVVGSVLFFSMRTTATGPELWRSKGTAKTTGMVKEIYPGPDGAEPESFAAVGSRLYFAAYTPGTTGDDYEVWRSDGTKAGTVMLKNINPDDYSEPDLLQNVGGTLWFFADDGVHGREPWRSDGTKAGTVMVKDVNPDAGSSIPDAYGNVFAKLGTRVYFAANDGTHGAELWRTTSGGAALWANIRPD